jgi:hypothetical protein
MRAFLTACCAIVVISLCAAIALDLIAQKPVSAAFATVAARVGQ